MSIIRDVKVTPLSSPVVLGDAIFHSPSLSNKNLLSTESKHQPLKFKTLFSLEPKYISQALAATQLFQQALSSSLEFNVSEAEKLAKANDISIETNIHKKISSGSPKSTISKLDTQLDEIIGGTFPVGLKSKLMAIVSDGFINLYRHEDSAWIFWSNKSENKSSYFYTMMVAIQEGDNLIVMPLGFYIQANVNEEKILFITVSSSAHYSVELNGLKGTQPLYANY